MDRTMAGHPTTTGADLEGGATGARPLYPAENLLKLHGKWPKIGEKWVCAPSIEEVRPLYIEILYPPLIPLGISKKSTL